jgi:ubiquinone/menaquinone biosynthesis C-methylase UbiE
MKVPRNLSIGVQFVLDELVPPIIRDSKWFMYLPMKFVLKDTAYDFMTFKNWVFQKTDKEFGQLYERTLHAQEIQGETDLNEQCLHEILKAVKGKKVLEVGCGRGLLADKLSENNKVTACDIVVPQSLKDRFPAVTFSEANIEHLPFKDKSFDTVITTHTLEHVRDLPKAVAEIKRVAKHEVIIVVPRQRPYKYTFSLHTQFFPYRWSLETAFGYTPGKTQIKKLGDWYYIEKRRA